MRDSARTVPRAIALAMLGIVLLYIALQVSAQGILGAALPGASAPLADAAGRAFSGWARTLLLAGAASFRGRSRRCIPPIARLTSPSSCSRC